jgi:hypothetical protein
MWNVNQVISNNVLGCMEPMSTGEIQNGTLVRDDCQLPIKARLSIRRYECQFRRSNELITNLARSFDGGVDAWNHNDAVSRYLLRMIETFRNLLHILGDLVFNCTSSGVMMDACKTSS